MSVLGKLIEGEIRRHERETEEAKSVKYGDYKVSVESASEYEKRFKINSWKAEVAKAVIDAVKELQDTTKIIPSDFDITKESLKITISPIKKEDN